MKFGPVFTFLIEIEVEYDAFDACSLTSIMNMFITLEDQSILPEDFLKLQNIEQLYIESANLPCVLKLCGRIHVPVQTLKKM